jgi:transposase-like protein
MPNTLFVCPSCEQNFEVELIPAEVAKKQRINTKPVTCPYCNSADVFKPE